jgi:hypothetical protein
MGLRHWLRTDDARLPLDGGSLLIGRNFDCDIVLSGERVSRHHALVRVTDAGVEVVALGGGPTMFGAKPVEGAQPLRVGDRFEIDGHTFSLEADALAAEPGHHWFIEPTPGVLVRVAGERVTVGGGDDDVAVSAWPASAVALAALGERLVLEANVADVRVGRALDVGEMVHVESGELIACGAVALRVVALPADPSKPTAVTAADEPVTSAVLSFFPRGGRLALRVGARERKVYLAEKRSELVALLLQPPPPYAAGDFVPDAVLLDRLWPGGEASRTDLNTLLWRVRRDFADAGLDRVNLFERKGGGLRVRLPPGSRAEVQGSFSGA